MSETPAMLRLGLPAGDLRQARQHPLLKGRARRGRQTLMLLDTPDRILAHAGWLCLSHADAAQRSQELLPIAGQALGPAPELPDNLQIIAQGEVVTASVPLGEPGILAQFIETRLQHDGDEAVIEEVVLQGPPEISHAVAVRLCDDVALHWDGVPGVVAATVSLKLAEARPVRASQIAYALPDQANAVAAFTAIARHCLAQFDANIPAVLDDRDLEGVHQMRVALRRLRSGIHVFRPILPMTALEPLVAELRWLNGPLGEKRDLDVFLHETLQPLQARGAPADGLARIAEAVAQHRTEAQATLDASLRSTRCAAWRLNFAKLLDELPALASAPVEDNGDNLEPAPWLLPGGARSFAAEILRKRRRKVKKLGERHAELDTAQLHELRIHAKRLRYAVEFFRPLFGKKDVRRFLTALTQLQDCLGALNDAAVGERLMRDTLGVAMDEPAAAAITGWFAGRERLQLDHLGACWDGFTRNKPFWKDALEA